MTVFSPLEIVIRGRVAGAYSLVALSIPKPIHGDSQRKTASHHQPRRKLQRNLCHFFLSSCFPKTIPTSPRATHPAPEKSATIGMLPRNMRKPRGSENHPPISIGYPRFQPSQRLTIQVRRSVKRRNMIQGLEFFYGTIAHKKFS